MTRKLLSGAASAVIAVGVLCVLSTSASAGGVATRCDGYGCARVVCHDHGNRCYRADDEYYGRSGYDRYRDYRSDYRFRDGYYRDDRAYRYYDRDGRDLSHDCDRDGDRCAVRRQENRGW